MLSVDPVRGTPKPHMHAVFFKLSGYLVDTMKSAASSENIRGYGIFEKR